MLCDTHFVHLHSLKDLGATWPVFRYQSLHPFIFYSNTQRTQELTPKPRHVNSS